MRSGVRFVLVRPRVPENLGAAARALANFGFEDWALVRLGTHDFAKARRVAVHAEGLLDRPRIVGTLDEAVADCTWVVATTSRRVRGRRPLDPTELGRRLSVEGQRGRTALVFGDERDGLSADEIRRCDEISTIPTRGGQPSLNLAQAVAVYAFSLLEAAEGPRAVPADPPGASDGELGLLEESLREALRRGGFLVGPERHAVRELAGSVRRARLTKSEVRLWVAALRRLARPGPSTQDERARQPREHVPGGGDLARGESLERPPGTGLERSR
ncbi:MAG TPA: RNA methyltransferase [Anaeromyxobacteraceae bacterium]|nr:RNA methyltransferase [Anaeromyxobacteraceae bacterium]